MLVTTLAEDVTLESADGSVWALVLASRVARSFGSDTTRLSTVGEARVGIVHGFDLLFGHVQL